MKTLLIGYYGHGNLGDECLKKQSISWISLCDPNGSVTTSKSDFLNVDCIVYGGGGLFQNVTSFRSLLWYCMWAFLARLFGKPYGLLGQGIGPVTGWFSTMLLDSVLKHAAFITVRDERSLERVERVRPAEMGPDMAFFSEYMDSYDKSGGVGVNLRPFKTLDDDLVEEVQDMATYFLSFSPEDNGFSGEMSPINMAPYFLDAVSFTKRLKGIIAMRFHACVWATLHGIPFFALVYDEKVKLLAETLGQPYVDLRYHNDIDTFKEDCALFLKRSEVFRVTLLEKRAWYLSETNVHFTALKRFYNVK